MFKTVERDALTVHGWITTLNAPNSPDGLAEMSKQKMRAKEEYASKIEGDLLAVNAVINGDQCYLIGNTDTTETRPSEFELPAGTYARFDLSYTDQVELDQLIGRCYGELNQSEAFQIAGNFNLEEYTGVGKMSFYVPVHQKNH
ncbi:effector binding domain-containing protein [Enterococcus sp.]|uniref:effector binding domain-containing protein n=1 Tax=Enterococcus sp. TaxID=35783 RepID=UPI0029099D67|nr:effector binding domain-containing protein [Enterococcus sp.]MDU5335474.1 effector binding domain-containing protein [Enterococcus sp.]